MTTIQYVVAVGMSLVLFVLLANLVVDEYGRGVARAAVDEGARAGANVDASSRDCELRGHDVVASLLGRALTRSVRFSCQEVGGSMRAEAVMTFRSWMPLIPDWTVRLVGSSPKERDP